MIIRKLTSADFDAVNEIYMQLHEIHVKNRPDVYRKIAKPTTDKAWGFEASLDDDNIIMLGAEIDSKVVGFSRVILRNPMNSVLAPRIFAQVDEIAVDIKYRRKGIGKALYQESVSRAKAHGATSVELKVWSFNREAIAFYQSLGMKIQNFTMEQTIN